MVCIDLLRCQCDIHLLGGKQIITLFKAQRGPIEITNDFMYTTIYSSMRRFRLRVRNMKNTQNEDGDGGANARDKPLRDKVFYAEHSF